MWTSCRHDEWYWQGNQPVTVLPTFTWLFPVFALDMYLCSSLCLWTSRDHRVFLSFYISEVCSWVLPMWYARTGVNFRIFPNSPYSKVWLREWPAFENGIWGFIHWSKSVLGTFVVYQNFLISYFVKLILLYFFTVIWIAIASLEA